MKIKVCGITMLSQLKNLQELGVDFAGLIFYEHSKRFVGDKLVQHSSEIKGMSIQKVGVFVNEAVEKIEELVGKYGLDYVQLHGDESVHFCKEVEAFVPVIKAIRVSEETNLGKLLDEFKDACTYFLFDSDSKQYGGTGVRFNWHLLEKVKMTKPFFLSGGIGEEHVPEIKKAIHSQLFAIDVNSRFETEPGVKDMEKVEAFINAIK